MFSKNLEAAMNEQIKHELYSAYLYLAMSAYCESANLGGTARWLAAQAKEEQGHAFKFYGYIHDRGGKVTLQAIPQPPADFGSIMDIFQEVQKHEAHVTSLITGLYELALQDKDYASQAMLQWFITEQVEEEKNAAQIVETLRMAGAQGAALFQIDHWLGERK